jgi:hypothetical protein
MVLLYDLTNQMYSHCLFAPGLCPWFLPPCLALAAGGKSGSDLGSLSDSNYSSRKGSWIRFCDVSNVLLISKGRD